MASPLSVRKNNYINNPKRCDIATPQWLSRRIYDILSPSLDSMNLVVLDPAIGDGSLTNIFRQRGAYIQGIDILDKSEVADQFAHGKFEDFSGSDFAGWSKPELIICNPPFNSARGRKLYPEVFLRHIDNLYGNKTPVVLICPMGMRLNQRMNSKRWRYMRDRWEISSVMSLPIDAFNGVLFHAEILFFNLPLLNAHYYIEQQSAFGP